MIQLIILDFDGTLADTRDLIVRTNQESMRRMGFPVADEASIISTIGLPLGEGILRLFPDLPLDRLPACEQLYRKVFYELKDSFTPALFPHVKETMEALLENGCRFTVASSRGHVSLSEFLCDMGIAPMISYVLGAEDVSRAKPHPEPVLKTLRDLGCDASDALVVGDMPVDILMGLGAGAWTCGVTYGNSSREALLSAGAHHVIDDFAELLPWLESTPDRTA